MRQTMHATHSPRQPHHHSAHTVAAYARALQGRGSPTHDRARTPPIGGAPGMAMDTPTSRQFHVDVGARLRTAREALGISQIELSRRAGCSSSTVSRIEAGRIEARYDTLADLALVLGTTADTLLGRNVSSGGGVSYESDGSGRLVMVADGDPPPWAGTVLIRITEDAARFRAGDRVAVSSPDVAGLDGRLFVVVEEPGGGLALRKRTRAGELHILEPLDGSGDRVVDDGQRPVVAVVTAIHM